MKPIIELNRVTYRYPGGRAEALPALRGISLRIEAESDVAIIGANGSGKSTLARHLNALLIPTEGSVRIEGLDTRDPANHPEIRKQVGMVFQRPEDQIIASVVEEDVAFGLENMGLPPERIRERVREALESVGMWHVHRRPPRMLSAGQMQRLALAGVLAMEPRCVLFDEATAMLDPIGRRQVRQTMDDLHAQGRTVIAITHRMEEALRADRVIVMSEGRIVLDGTPGEVFNQPEALRDLGLGLPPGARIARTLHQYLPAVPETCMTADDILQALADLDHAERIDGPSPSGANLEKTTGPSLIEVTGLSHTYMKGTPFAERSLNDVTVTITEGQRHGLLGPTGAGKSTLLQHFNGLLRPQSGRVRVGSHDLNDPKTDLQAVRRQIGLVFQLPEAQIFEQYVGDEIAYGPRLQGLDGEQLRERVRWAMEQVGLDFEADKDRYTFALSGGQKRKVALASILALRPRALLLDEPTAGLDPRASRELLDNLRTLNAEGMTLVISSHRMEELAAMAQQLTVLDAGSTVLRGTPSEVFARGEALREIGLDQPLVTKIADELYVRGWPIVRGITNPEVLSRQIAEAVRQ